MQLILAVQWPQGEQPEDFEVERRRRKHVPGATEQNGFLTRHILTFPPRLHLAIVVEHCVTIEAEEPRDTS